MKHQIIQYFKNIDEAKNKKLKTPIIAMVENANGAMQFVTDNHSGSYIKLELQNGKLVEVETSQYDYTYDSNLNNNDSDLGSF